MTTYEDRRYHVEAVVNVPGRPQRVVLMTAQPVTHPEGCTILTKLVPRPTHRYRLAEVAGKEG